MISEEIKQYKEAVSTLNASELLAVLNNSRLSKDERFAVELIDLYGKSIKEASSAMDIDIRLVNKYLNRARNKFLNNPPSGAEPCKSGSSFFIPKSFLKCS